MPSPVTRRVLIVEDDADARGALRTLLELEGHEVHEAADGAAAVDTAFAVRPDVALIDLGLPGVDGLEVARRLRATKAGKSMRLIALTGYGQPSDVQRAEDAGFDAHLVKPADADTLLSLL